MTNSLRKIAAAIAVPAALTFALTACGGEAGHGRPSADDLVKALTTGKAAKSVGLSDADPKVIKCIAQKFEDSKLSDDALRAIVNGDEDFKGKGGDKAALSDIESQMSDCVTAAQ